MRTYTSNSPQAAGRIVAIALLADGHLNSSELAAVHRARIAERLGLAPGEFSTILRELCEDLLTNANMDWSDACKLDSDIMQQVLLELEDPVLRAEVLSLCLVAIHADRHLSESEAQLLAVLSKSWQANPWQRLLAS
ncbi:putative tellurite resistance protein B-like protein [Paraburkholderia bannensis]|uniref:Putative tellurite resistance protein B-like protein n=1 Tax=Paraburkholderia bannensis TaxID=765414 RepID=A0A7W9WSR0_9BURK|nr:MULTISPECIES: TerB family tellurite resistance protein [Paraburkholderia]MBB3257044.1 putative tellurite resistance protein B-like protein [Paraburkholderia sp. WP4_3_2]MBB6101998.1 putative tellurite resistance protein B-like protein [Paraburkholderia bannensis]